MNIGGKLLTKFLKCDGKDEEGRDLEIELKKVRNSNVREGCRWFDREFVLPDFVERFKGSVRLLLMLQRIKDLERQEMEDEKGEDEQF